MLLARRAVRAAKQPRTESAQVAAFASPTAGLIRNRNLAIPQGAQGAEVLNNFFPTTRSAILRRGSQGYAQLGEGIEPVVTMFKYVNGGNRKLFASTPTIVYDITVVTQAYNYSIGLDDEWTMALEADPGSDTIGQNSVDGSFAVLTGQTGGQWSTAQFSTTGGVFLVGVNGMDAGFVYDGATFSPLADAGAGITFPAEFPDLTTANFAYVWVYKNRLWFAEKNTMRAWYLPVDQIGGELAPFDLGSEFPRGGALLFGQNWSLQTGESGGLSDQCIFVSTEGEIVVYQGTNPAEASAWQKVGLYRVGKPLGLKAMIRAGGDIIISTDIGFIPISKAIQFAEAALSPNSVSYPIETLWNDTLAERGGDNWNAVLWPEQRMTVVAPPMDGVSVPYCFVANARTGAWAVFTGWDIRCMETFNGRLLFGSADGKIKDAMVGGDDDGLPYTGEYVPLFSDEGAATRRKVAKNVRSETISSVPIEQNIGCRFDFNTSLPPVPDTAVIPTGSQWGNAVWNQSIWNDQSASVHRVARRSAGGSGYRLAPLFQVTSGAVIPLDVEIVSLHVTYDFGGTFT